MRHIEKQRGSRWRWAQIRGQPATVLVESRAMVPAQEAVPTECEGEPKAELEIQKKELNRVGE